MWPSPHDPSDPAVVPRLGLLAHFVLDRETQAVGVLAEEAECAVTP